ncbi:amidohydrolase family protein [Proteinivorax hydrogeniformans]|uniref:Amidohydrolase family protein n=1 Tax=Proteinivorax hydrogeniformans TaxID=1826727 RepID=A0AAU8HR46_9FIRM
MEIIDSHMHYSNIHLFKNCAQNKSKVLYNYEGLISEFVENNIVGCVAMGVSETSIGSFPDTLAPNPMIADLANRPDFLYTCLGINPFGLRNNPDAIMKIEEKILDNKVVGFKLYPGYYPVTVDDDVYQPVYDLAEKYKMPIVIHMGDTFCPYGHIKYSQPLTLSEVVLHRRNVNFIVAHFGNPWVLDTAMLVANNPNVYTDLSGIFIGDKEDVLEDKNKPVYNNIKTGIAYCENYEKLLFGSDWPLVKLKPYIDFVKKIIPKENHQQVFHDNALKLFPALKSKKS